ncbi:hypothetical protein LTR36_010376 [Oleoguttula mirabilis]|uniref:Enoyl reductase (ER) domain-containing protein n=1 Tax=Oleoguttula mirabilis TaxID=1507867 RepID=A0AAV9J519_9PEZI|nr:hypothetical protein LTR36_010376 [Oleoguttula mirabilis]
MAASISANQAVWQQAAFDKAFVVGPGPDQTKPADDEMVIKVAYVAINPSEWKVRQDISVTLATAISTTISQPIDGLSCVLADPFASIRSSKTTAPASCAAAPTTALFQLYTAFRERLTATLPDAVPFSKGVVLPLALSTATVGLFETLKFRLPTTPATPSSGETVLIWGGSSSVGSVAIQLARAAGYDVVATARVGWVFDYADAEVVQKLTDFISDKNKNFAGALDCISEAGAPQACAAITKMFGGGVLPTVLWPPKDLPEGVEGVLIYASDPGTEDKYLAASVWETFVPAALESGVLLPKPDPEILTGGLANVQDAVDLSKKGVSAKKTVVEIDASVGL